MPLDTEAAIAESPVTVPWSTQFDLASAISGRTYRIYVFQPPLPPPEGGYPTLVVLDGDMTFHIAAAMAATYAFSAAPVLVVGVGYGASPMEMQVLRYRDLTPPTPAEGLPKRLTALGPEYYGGASEFLGFLTEELRPAIAAKHTIDPAREALFGYSLGGLFVLDALFRRPNDYRSYIAASPSIWWNERDVLRHEAGFVRAVQAGEASPRVLITVGDQEQAAPRRLPPGMNPQDVEALIGEGRMVDNAWELGSRLEKLTADGYHACFHAFENEDHLTGLAASIGRALDFAQLG